MSLAYFNTSQERRLLHMCLLSALALIQEGEAEHEVEDDDMDEESNSSSSTQSSSSSLSSDSSMSSGSSSSLSNGSSESFDDMSISSDYSNTSFIEEFLHATAEYGFAIYAPSENTEIEWGKKPLIDDFDDSECLDHFRFRKVDVQHLSESLWQKLQHNLLGTKDKIQLPNRYVAPYETILLILLCRFSRPRRLHQDMEELFGMRSCHISIALSTISSALLEVALPFFDNPQIFHHRMPFYADRIGQKCNGQLNQIWGFIDGTFRRICRPKLDQQQAYSGHKRTHGVKFQAVVVPDGLIACLFGPIPGHRHDSFMLLESELIDKLKLLMPEDGANGPVFALYGDAAYPQSMWLLGGFRDPLPNSPEAEWNSNMSKCRIAVEWGFMEVTRLWSFIDFKRANRIYLSPYAQYYINCVFLTNLRTCCYGNQVSAYFECQPPSIDEYLALHD